MSVFVCKTMQKAASGRLFAATCLSLSAFAKRANGMGLPHFAKWTSLLAVLVLFFAAFCPLAHAAESVKVETQSTASAAAPSESGQGSLPLNSASMHTLQPQPADRVSAQPDSAHNTLALQPPQQAARVSPPTPGDFSWGGYFRAIGLMLLFLGVVWVAVAWMRRSGRFPGMIRPGSLPRDGLYIEGQISIGPRKGLMVVRFLNKRVLLGVTDQRISLLTETELSDAASFAAYMDDVARDSEEEAGQAVAPPSGQL